MFATGLSLDGLAFSTWLEDAGVPAGVIAALDERIGRALAIPANLLRERRDSRVADGEEGR